MLHYIETKAFKCLAKTQALTSQNWFSVLFPILLLHRSCRKRHFRGLYVAWIL